MTELTPDQEQHRQRLVGAICGLNPPRSSRQRSRQNRDTKFQPSIAVLEAQLTELDPRHPLLSAARSTPVPELVGVS